jgi:hypothetical protein
MRRTPYYPPALAALLALASFATPAGVQARFDSQAKEDLRSLTPGEFVVQEQVVPVDIVFVGYEGQIDNAALLGDLPATYTPIVRDPAFYGLRVATPG